MQGLPFTVKTVDKKYTANYCINIEHRGMVTNRSLSSKREMGTDMDNTYVDRQAGVPESGWRIGLSGSTIKMLGIVTMFIDHVGAALVLRLMIDMYARQQYETYTVMSEIYTVMRGIGRLGFPVFCFLLVEGFEKTRSKTKYAIRLGLFALISEIPFDLAFSAEVLEFDYQNVYFTLFLGLLALCAFDFINKQKLPKVLTVLLELAALAVFMLAARFLRTDYAAMGVLTIAVMYVLRFNKPAAFAGGCIVLCLMAYNEIPAFFAVLPVSMYNGKRGWKLKYFFYAFYPVHLLLIWLIAYFLGMGSIQVV